MWFWPTLQCVFLTLPSCVVFYLAVWYFTLLCDILPCCMVSDSPCYVVFDPDGLPLLTAWLDLWAQSHQIPGPHVHIQHLQELHIVYQIVGAVLTLWHHAINKTKLYTIQTITYFPGSSEYSWNNVASASLGLEIQKPHAFWLTSWSDPLRQAAHSYQWWISFWGWRYNRPLSNRQPWWQQTQASSTLWSSLVESPQSVGEIIGSMNNLVNVILWLFINTAYWTKGLITKTEQRAQSVNYSDQLIFYQEKLQSIWIRYVLF